MKSIWEITDLDVAEKALDFGCLLITGFVLFIIALVLAIAMI